MLCADERREAHQVCERRRVEAEGEEGGVGLHVDLGAAAHGVEPPHRDVALVAEAEPYDVEHGGGGGWRRAEPRAGGGKLTV
jgi:hypothetical protein